MAASLELAYEEVKKAVPNQWFKGRFKGLKVNEDTLNMQLCEVHEGTR